MAKVVHCKADIAWSVDWVMISTPGSLPQFYGDACSIHGSVSSFGVTGRPGAADDIE